VAGVTFGKVSGFLRKEKPLVAMASNDLFEAVVEALESPETPEGHPDLALEIDERSQQLAYELRAFRGGLIDRGWKPA